LTVDGQHIKMMVPDAYDFLSKLDVRVKTLVETIEMGMDMLHDSNLVHGNHGQFITVVDKGNGIVNRHNEFMDPVVQLTEYALFDLSKRVHVFGCVQHPVQW